MNRIPCLAPLLEQNYQNCIFPFLWLRGENEKILREEIAKIDECGIKAICLESRPHPDFVGPKWWKDFDIVLEEAKKRDMKIWILDDSHFPTGLANGLLPKKYPKRARQYIMIQHADVVGSIPYAELDVALMMTKRFTWMDFGKPKEIPLIDEVQLLSVIAIQVIEGDLLEKSYIDLTNMVSEGTLHWDVPEGVWRICVCFTTYDFGTKNDYINYIDHDSVSTLIEAVYEPHYQHYAKEFGKTIAGFFSDEPGFYNTSGFNMDESIGRKIMPLPWNSDMSELMEKQLGSDWKQKLSFLWFNNKNDIETAYIRYIYMDIVSQLYAEHFCKQIGKWCRERNVEYIGHVIEDNNQHSRLGCGAAHYFRAISGQDMAGIDTIGGRIVPGNPLANRHSVGNKIDGEFSHYALGKMGASAAQIDPNKKGRLMCETYGAYGWNLGVKGMKWLTDYLFLQGVNRLVPHAFSMKDYPDDECPPHFYARGCNPQFPWFAQLMKYANRMCNLLSDGQNVPQVAILYHGELEWINDCMLMQKPARLLAENQIDFEFIPIDTLVEPAYFRTKVEEGCLIVNNRKMKVLIVPETDYIPMVFAQFLNDNPSLKVIFINKIPLYVSGDNQQQCIKLEEFLQNYEFVKLEELVEYLLKTGIHDVITETKCQELGIYHYYKQNSNIYFLFNTSLWKKIKTKAYFPLQDWAKGYDADRNEVFDIFQTKDKNGICIEIDLKPYESLVLIFDKLAQPASNKLKPVKYIDISKDWILTLSHLKEYPNFFKPKLYTVLEPVSKSSPKFSGIMRYEKTVNLVEFKGKLVFKAEYIYESAELFINGVSAGKRITPDYIWDISKLYKFGENHFCVEVVNTPTRDTLKNPGIFGPEREFIEPSGMFGQISIINYC